MLTEDENCPCPNCTGTIIVRQKACYCSNTPMPPCANCTNAWLECSECGYQEGDPIVPVQPIIECPVPLCNGIQVQNLDEDKVHVIMECSICDWRSDRTQDQNKIAHWGEW